MDQQHFRAVLAAAIVVILAAGLYVGYHVTHPPKPCPSYWTAQGRTC